MGARAIACAIALVSLGIESSRAQFGDSGFSLNLRGTYTTTSRLFLNPESPSPDTREDNTMLDGVFGFGAELRSAPLGDKSFFALSVEYIQSTFEELQVFGGTNPPSALPVKDGYRLIPVELSGHIFVPLQSDRIRIALGGGVGVYFGERIFSVAGVSADPVGISAGFGIHVRTMIEYRLYSNVYVSWDMKFRDPEVNTRNKFSQQSAVYQGITLQYPQYEIASRVNLDGITFSLGVTVDL